MRTTIAELVAVLAMDSTKFKQGIAGAQTSASKLATNLGAIGKRMTTMVSLPIAAIGVATTKMAMDFETQMANVFTLMDDATVHSRDWKKEVLDLSKKVPQSTDVLSKGLYDIVSAGIDAGKAIDVLTVASKAATAGLSDTATAVKGITTVLNAYGMEADEAEYVSDVLFTTIRYGVTTFDELAPAIGKVAGVAATANVSIEEVGAALAAMTKAGLDTDMATTALKQTMMSFLKPTDDAKEAAAELGVDLSAVTLSTKGLGGSLEEISTALNISTDEMMVLGEAGISNAAMYDTLAIKSGLTAEKIAEIFPNIRALIGAMVLLKEENFAEELEHQANAAGATSTAFATMAETTKFQFDLALSSLKATGIEIGTKLLPLATRLFEAIGNLADEWGELSDSTQDAVIKMAGIIAVVGPLAWVTSKVWKLVLAVKGLSIATKTTIATITPLIAGYTALAAAGLGVANRLDAITFGFKKNIVTVDGWNRRIQEIINILLLGIPEIATELTNLFLPDKWKFDKFELGFGAMIEGLFGTGEATEELTDKETELTDRIAENTDTIMEWRFANEGIIGILDELRLLQEDGTLSLEDYDKAVQYLVDTEGTYMGTTKEVLKATGLLTEEHYKAEAAIAKAAEGMNIYTMTAEELNDAFTNGKISSEQYAEGLRNIEEAAGDSQEAIDDLRSSFNKLVDDIFGHITTYNDFQEAGWAVEEAEKALTEAIKKHGEGSKEAMQAQNDLDDTNIEAIKTSFELSTSIKATTEQQEEARRKAVELGFQYIETGDIGVEEFWRMATEFGLSSADIIRLANEMEIEIDKATENKLIEIDADTSGVDEGVEHTNEELAKVPRDIPVTITVSSNIGKLGWEGIESKRSGGLEQAQSGLNIDSGGARPVLIHPPELILNKEQALNVLWNMANQPVTSMGNQGASIINEFNISELVVREEADVQRIAEELADMQETSTKGVGIR